MYVTKNMITYKFTKHFNKEQLEKLFLSVGWASGEYPDKLVKAMTGYQTVISAWDNDRLVGIVAAMDDGVMTAYIHYLLVMPEYQHNGIGRKLMELIKERYVEYLKILLIAYSEGVKFYRLLGFNVPDNSIPMYLTDMY